MVISILQSKIRTVVVDCKDTDVFIILLVNYPCFQAQNKTVLMQRNNTDFLNINSIVEALQSKGIKLESLALLHALSGCDTVLSVRHREDNSLEYLQSTSHTS